MFAGASVWVCASVPVDTARGPPPLADGREVIFGIDGDDGGDGDGLAWIVAPV